MATTTSRTLLKEMLLLSSTLPFPSLHLRPLSLPFLTSQFPLSRSAPSIRCASSDSGANKVSSRLSQVQHLLHQAEERALSADTGPTPKITLDHVTVSFARSGGPGGQNVNKVNTKVDMRFNVQNAYWLSDRIRNKIVQMEKNRINKDGELVISSTKTRTQKFTSSLSFYLLFVFLLSCKISWPNSTLFSSGVTLTMLWQNFRVRVRMSIGTLVRLCASTLSISHQEIIDAASYVPPPPSEEQKKKIAKMAAIGEHKRLKSKKVLSDKKAFRRSKNSWD